MKRQVQYPGVRKWSGDDLLELQGESLIIADKFFSQFGDCVITGCAVNGDCISGGLVSISGMVMSFAGIEGVEVFPLYLVKDEEHFQREYADEVVRNVAVKYFAKAVYEKPANDFIECTAEGAPLFFDNIKPGWVDESLKDIQNQLNDLAEADADMQAAIELLLQICNELQEFDVSTGKRLTRIESLLIYTPTLEAKPTEATLTYQVNEIVQDFLIGQQCRVYDAAAEKYVFYQLYDITMDKKADWQIAGSDGSAFLETIRINVISNQGITDTTIYGSIIAIVYADQRKELVWNGVELSATIPMAIKYQVTCPNVEGYLSPETQEYTAIGGNKRAINLLYSTEKVAVNLTTNDLVSIQKCTTTLTNTETSQVIASKQGANVEFKVPFGVSYKVSVDKLAGYLTPVTQSFVANATTRTVSMEYEKIVDSSIVFDKSISDPENITGEVNSGVIAMILSKFRRCLCKKTANGEASISYLKNDDSRYYEDGSVAVLDGTQGDVMVDFPEFYYKYEKIDANKYRYRFAEYNVDGTFKHVPRSLVGAYKAYQTGNKLYSRSGVTPVTSTTYTNFTSYAVARGTGYQMIDFQQHCVIAFMLYAKYGNRNLQAVLGVGGATYSPATTTGTTNQKGNRDTANETSGYVNGMGLEGVFGGQYEWTQGVSIQNCVWTISDPDGIQRNVNAGAISGWIIGVAAEAGPFFDMVPTAIGGSETTHYSDYYHQASSGPYVLARSCYSSGAYGGVAYANALYAASYSHAHIGSRLAFRGVIREASSVEIFKALQVL